MFYDHIHIFLKNDYFNYNIFQTPLMRACEYGHLPVVEQLLDAGAAINRQTDECSSSLIVACHFGLENVVDFLLSK